MVKITVHLTDRDNFRNPGPRIVFPIFTIPFSEALNLELGLAESLLSEGRK